MRIMELGARRSAERRCSTLAATPRDPEHTETAKEFSQPSPPRVWPYPGTRKALDRPDTNLSGPRHVPKLINANRVPILRLKKPQPPFLSRIIRDTVNTREARIALCAKLQDTLRYANDEEEWDRILEESSPIPKRPSEAPWFRETQLALAEIHRLQTAAGNKRVAIAAQMHAIVEKEKALAMEEKSKKRDEKHKAKEARRFAKLGQQVTVAEEQAPVGEVIVDNAEQTLAESTRAKMKQKEAIGRSHGETDLVSLTDEEKAAVKAARRRRKEEAAMAKAAKLESREERAKYWKQKVNKDIPLAGKSTTIPLDAVWRHIDGEDLQRNRKRSMLMGLRQQLREKTVSNSARLNRQQVSLLSSSAHGQTEIAP